MDSAETALVVETGTGEDQATQALQRQLQDGLVETRDRLGIPEPDMPELHGGVAEPEYLKQIIREQEEARLEALEVAAELQQQLAAAQAEAARARTQYHGVPKSRDTVTRVEGALAETITKLHEVKKELDWEQRSRRADAIQASAKIQKLERELAEAIGATTRSKPTGHPMVLRMALGAVAAIALAAGIAAFAMHRQIPVSANDSFRAAAATPAAADQDADLAAWQSKSAVLGRHSAPAAGPDFTQSYNRLGQALAAFPGRDAEDVLRQVQKSGGGCGLRWNEGEPSLIFGSQISGEAKRPNSLPDALTQCAEAVEKLR
jgi:hypothetical protein